MKFLLHILVLFGSLNLILARSLFWDPYYTHGDNSWSRYYNYDDKPYALSPKQNSDAKNNFEKISKLFDKSSENSIETMVTKTSDELYDDDVVENLKATHLKEIESFLNVVLSDDISEDEIKTVGKNKDSSKEKDDNSDEHNKEENNTAENDDDDDDVTVKSQEQISVKDKESSEEKKPLNEYESKESAETLISNVFSNSQTTTFSPETLNEHDDEISEKDIRELTAILMTITTLDNLMKITENTSEDEVLLKIEELNEKKLDEVNHYLTFYSSLLDESSEVDKENEKSDNDDDKHSEEHDSDNENGGENDNDDDDDEKDNNDETKNNDQSDNNDDTSVSLEFHGIDNSQTNLDNHRYDILQKSITTDVELKPTSSPYLPKTFSSNADNNNAIQEYVEIREKMDNLQDNIFLNKLNMDKDFYDIIANESDDKNMKKFTSDIAVLRDNAYKMKQNIDDMQDIKSKLYFQKLIKAALKRAQFN